MAQALGKLLQQRVIILFRQNDSLSCPIHS